MRKWMSDMSFVQENMFGGNDVSDCPVNIDSYCVYHPQESSMDIRCLILVLNIDMQLGAFLH